MATIGVLTPRTVRDLYLRGFDLGAAWQGPSADAAIAALLDTQLAHAEALMGIHWGRWRVATMPDQAAVPGTDYDQLGNLIPYTPPLPAQVYHSLILRYHDVQAVTRVRLFEGYNVALPPAPVFETLPLDQLIFQSYDEALYVPVASVLNPTLALAWAVDYLIGIGTLPPEIVEWCALGAAIEVLSMAGSAADVTHGLSGEMLRQDGI